MLYNSFGIFILEILEYIVVYLFVIPLALFFILNILVGISKIRSEKNDKKIFYYSIVISLVFSIVLSGNISMLFNKSTTSINGKKDSDLKSRINQIIDFSKRETEIIYAKTNEIETYTKIEHISRTIRGGDKSYIGTKEYVRYYYYLDIKNGEYIIPLGDMTKPIAIEDLLYNSEYGKQMNLNNKIEVYKNTKFVKSINGIDINSDYETRSKFIDEKKYKIKINITEDGYFKYETEGCTLEEFINNENAVVSIFNEQGEEIVNTAQIFGKDNNSTNTFEGKLNINRFRIFCYPEGTYYAYVCAREKIGGKPEKASNGIKFRVDNKKQIIDFSVMDN